MELPFSDKTPIISAIDIKARVMGNADESMELLEDFAQTYIQERLNAAQAADDGSLPVDLAPLRRE
jgi:hypothetical protein